MSIAEILESVQYVVNRDGQQTAVQLDLEIWEALRELLENLEDSAEIEQARQEDDEVFEWEQVVSDYQLKHAVS